ncbi:MAG TPA: TonB family protein [Longimicrobium sp.]|nr:TonB family protein [Longimicrobium sp.]
MKTWHRAAFAAVAGTLVLASRAAAQPGVPADEHTYELVDVEVKPTVTNTVEIQRLLERNYPPELNSAGVRGTVDLRFRVLENGRVDSATVQVMSSSHQAFNAPAIRAVRRLSLTPAMVRGRPVKVWVQLPITFAGESPPASAAPPPGSTQEVRVGHFTAVVEADRAGRDRSFVIMWPHDIPEQTPAGITLWACGGDSAALSGAVSLTTFGVNGASRRAVLRFDQEAPDTLLLYGEHAFTLWFLGDDDVAPVLRRAVRADSLTIQVLDTVASFGGVFTYKYALAGLDSVLQRVGCPIAAPTPGRLAGREILRSRAPGGYPGPLGEGPRLQDTSAMQAYARRNYPPALRAAGVQGEVVFRVGVLANGRVDPARVRIVRSTNEGFDAVAIAALRQVRFARSPNGYEQGAAELAVRFTIPPP